MDGLSVLWFSSRQGLVIAARTGLEPTIFYSMVSGTLSRGCDNRLVKLYTRIRPVPKLRTNVAIFYTSFASFTTPTRKKNYII
jgi:hypothetical protein